MFEFIMEDYPPQTLPVAQASISLFAHVPPWQDRISLYVEIVAAEAEALPFDASGEPYRISPTFYTEWLEIPVTALNGRGLDLLDGYAMRYDEATAEADGFAQYPGAVYQDMHAGFQRATMELTYLGGARYLVTAEGVTEFGWRFRIETEAVLTMVSAKSGQEDGDKAPLAEVEDWFNRLYDPAAFPPIWSRKGNDEFFWYVYEAAPVVGGS